MTNEDFDPKQLIIQEIKMLAEQGINANEPLTEEVFAPIAKRYHFIPGSEGTARIVLNIAIAKSRVEVKLTATDLTKVRRKFEAVTKRAAALRRALEGLDADDLFVADHAALCQKFAADPETMEIKGEQPKDPSAVLFLENANVVLSSHDGAGMSLEEFNSTLDALTEAMTLSLKVAGKGRKGRPKDASLEGPLMVAYQMYVNFTGKLFTLDWHSDSSPLSDAASFCVEFVRVFDGRSPDSKIASMARQVKEKSIKVSNLEEVDEFISHFSERSR